VISNKIVCNILLCKTHKPKSSTLPCIYIF
jgi:hypothetical protein